MNKSKRLQIPAEVFGDPVSLSQAVNDALDDIYQRLAKIAPRQALLVRIQTPNTVTDAFPVTFKNPGFDISGLSIVKIDNQDDPNDMLTGGATVQWEKTTDGNGVIRNITGLAANTRYVIELEAIGGK